MILNNDWTSGATKAFSNVGALLPIQAPIDALSRLRRRMESLLETRRRLHRACFLNQERKRRKEAHQKQATTLYFMQTLETAESASWSSPMNHLFLNTKRRKNAYRCTGCFRRLAFLHVGLHNCPVSRRFTRLAFLRHSASAHRR